MAVVKKSRKKPVTTGSISAQELLKELPGARCVILEPGSVIFSEGSKAENCYVVIRGKVEVLKKIRKGVTIAVAVIKPGEFLGEMAMLSGEKRSATAVAVTQVEAIVIEHSDFVVLLKQQHPFASRLLLQLCTMLATRCHRLLRLIAHQPEFVPLTMKKAPPLDVRAALNRVYTLWAV